jgi:hypothetical protein
MALVCLWVAPLMILYTALASDWVSTWEAFAVPSMNPPFMDLWSISGGVRTLQQGGDPLVVNKLDPYHRPMNYPRIWLYLFSGLGIQDANVWMVGVTFCVLYLVCISWLIVQCKNIFGLLTLLIASLSLAPLLALERGNADLLVFVFVFLGCITTNRYLKPIAFFVATVLKIFPFAGVIIDVIRRPIKERFLPLLLTGLAVAVLGWQWRDLYSIRLSTPVSPTLSYGLLTLGAQAPYLSGGLLATGCVMAALIAAAAWLMRPKLDGVILDSKSAEMFLIFGGIYDFTFAIGSNWNYRLMFLVPTLPFVIELIRNRRHRRWAMAYIASVLVAENSFAFGVYQGIPTGDIATFGIFVMILIILLGQARTFLSSVTALLQAPATASSEQVVRS